jgi:16S rRNA C967 or C1407 C5-methylase (RsmB/RsmF family)
MSQSEVPWDQLARQSILLQAVSVWRDDPENWLAGSFDRLPETVRVNPLRSDSEWTEGWLEGIGSERIGWFIGPGSAWTLPFNRGAAEGDIREMLADLHETGRLTRQEAVSMLPAIALDAQPGEVVLDMCASPGSKTTQISEHLGEAGAVFANEVVNSRVNMLVTNVQRHGSRTPVGVHHDGRYIPRVPESGFDRILVDVPCTGSGTTRKNPDVWGKWLPSGGRSLHDLQVALLSRAVALVKPGGRVVYATCSLDPVEDEAVVAEVLRNSEGVDMKSVMELLPDVPGEAGRTDWPSLDDGGGVTVVEIPESMQPPSEQGIASQLPRSMRVWNDKIGGGGFFLAVLEKSEDAPERPAPEVEVKMTAEEVKPDSDNSPRPIPDEVASVVESAWGALPDDLWLRGKRLLLSTPEVHDVWESERSRRGGRTRIPGGRWRPLKVIHLGLSAARLRRGDVERIVAGAAHELAPRLPNASSEVDGDLIDALLADEEMSPDEAGVNAVRGGHILIDRATRDCVPVWVGVRVSLMLGKAERRILSLKRGLSITEKEEE